MVRRGLSQQGPNYEDHEQKSKEEFKTLCFLKKDYFQKEDGCPVGMGYKERIYPRGKGREKRLVGAVFGIKVRAHPLMISLAP